MNTIFSLIKPLAISACIITGAVSCANQSFQQMGSSLLSSTGLVSGSQADAMFKAGGKIVAAASPLTSEQEYYLGRSVSAMILTEYPLYRDATATNYVNTVGNALAAYSDRPETFVGYHFAILNTSEINALSTPGGFVFISRGLLKSMPNEDALAAVLAHEIGHIVKGHGVKAISQANLSSAAMILGKEAASSYGNNTVQAVTSAFGDSVTDVFNTILKKGYSRSQEYDADAYASELLKRVGYSHGSLVSMLHSLESAHGGKESGLFATHPSPEKRISELSDSKDDSAAPSLKRTNRFKSAIKNG